MPAVNPEILTWARETAGFSVAEAARVIGIRDARGKTAQERLHALEEGEGDPTRPQLRKMAEKYRRPLLVFYLDQPPRKGDRGQDFRMAPGAPAPAYDATLDALMRDIHARHEIMKSLLEDEEASSLGFIDSATMQAGVDAVAQSIIDTIGFDLQEFREQDSVDDAFLYLRSRLEGARIFVLLLGNLGTYHTDIAARTFRGFAIADQLAPVIVINPNDARAAWSFTAMHEATHLFLGTTGISGGVSAASAGIAIERFCDQVAARILLVPGEIDALSHVGSGNLDDASADVSAFADARNISRSMVVYNLWQAGIISQPRWQQLADHFYQQWLQSRRERKERQRRTEGGPSYYVVRRHRLGTALLHLVNRSLGDGLITYTKASRVLGVKPRGVGRLLRGES